MAGKKLTSKQDAAVKRVANNLRMSDSDVRLIVSEFLGEQSARPPAKRTRKTGAK